MHHFNWKADINPNSFVVLGLDGDRYLVVWHNVAEMWDVWAIGKLEYDGTAHL